MFAVNRRRERREELIHRLAADHDRDMEEWVDFTEFEAHDVFLEGTGSLILDRPGGIVYASVGPRTDARAAEQFADTFGMELEAFTAFQTAGDRQAPIYHTNVMLAIGTDWAVVCDEIVTDDAERQALLDRLTGSGKGGPDHRRASQWLCGQRARGPEPKGERLIAMSSAAHASFTETQRATLASCARLVHAPIPTIEKLGGGSVRCMLAEVFLPKVQD